MGSKKLSRYATIYLLAGYTILILGVFDDVEHLGLFAIGCFVLSTINHVGSIIVNKIERISNRGSM